MSNVKPIIIKDNETGEEYTLEFSRESVKFAESRGFSIDDVDRYPMTKIPELWFYAFRMHHKALARDKTDKLLDALEGIPDGLMKRLGELYAAPFTELFGNDDETEDGEEKNSRVTVMM